MGYGSGDGDLTGFEKAVLGISGAHSVYLIRNSQGDVVSIKAVDHVSNRENVIDLKSPMRREGQSSIVEAAKMVYQGMQKLPQNYIAVMSPSGQVSRGTLTGVVGYSPESSRERNARGVALGVGSVALLESFAGGGRRAVSADSYGPGESAAYFSEGRGGYSGSFGEGKPSAAKEIGRGEGGEEDEEEKKRKKKAPSGHPVAELLEKPIEVLLKELADLEQKRIMDEALALRRSSRKGAATVNYSGTYSDDLVEVWEASVF